MPGQQAGLSLAHSRCPLQIRGGNGVQKRPWEEQIPGQDGFHYFIGQQASEAGRSDFIFCWKNEGLRAQGSALGKHHKEFILVEVFEVTL